MVEGRPVFWAQSVWSRYAQGMDPMGDRLASPAEMKKMELSPVKTSAYAKTLNKNIKYLVVFRMKALLDQ